MEATREGGIAVSDYFRNGYVLVVDDARNMRKTIKNMLRSIGISGVVEAEDGDVVIDTLKQTPERCQFILLDWSMPRMAGLDVARELKADSSYREIPILMITAEANYGQVSHAGEFGVEGYILKPFGAKTLEDKMADVIADRINPPQNIKLLRAGERMMAGGEFEKALALFREAAKLGENARIMVSMAEAHEKLGQVDEAAALLRDALEKNPQFLKGHTAAAEFFQRRGDAAATLKHLRAAAEISPSNSDRHQQIGMIQLEQGDEHDARLAFHEAIRHDPARSTEIAEELLKRGKAEMAETYFRWSLENESTTVHVYNRLGIALRRQGKWKEAVDEYKLAHAIDPEDEIILFNMGRAYMEGRHKRDAAQCFMKALKINPDFAEARKELDNIS